MSSDLVQVYTMIFSKCWQFFTAFKIPGTTFTPAIMFLFVSVLGLGIKFIRSFVGLSWDTRQADFTHIRERINYLKQKYD